MSKRKNRGVITVLVSLMLVGILSIGTLSIEAGRFQTAKTQMAEANSSAATSMIAAYDTDLYGRYGLLAIDTEKFTPQRATDYLNFNSDLSSGYKGNRLTRMYTIESVELEGIYNLTYPQVLKRQILSRAKYHVIPQNYALNVNTMNAFFADLQNKCQYVSNQLAPVSNGSANVGSLADVPANMQNALKSLYSTYYNLEMSDEQCKVTLAASDVALLPSVTGTVSADAPSEDITTINNALADANAVLGSEGNSLSYLNGTGTTEIDVNLNVDFVSDVVLKLKDISTAENIATDGRQLVSSTRALAQGINNAINMLNSDREGNVLLNSYIAEYFSNRNNRISTYTAPAKGTTIDGSMSNASFASACVEYVFGGDASETINQYAAYEYIQAIRLINNLYSVLTNSTSFNANNLYSVAAHVAWANYESIVDMELLTVYNVSVPFNKNNMILNITNPGSVTSAFGSKNTANAMNALGYHNGTNFTIPGANSFSYKDSLALALWFVPNSQKLLRVADLIQIEMRYKEAHVDNKSATFLMSGQNTFCRIKCIGRFNSVLPTLSLGSGQSTKGAEIQSIKYAGY